MDHGHHHDGAVEEPPADFGRHNMVALGHDTVFLSHLPMFMAPHDAQLILEVGLTRDGADAVPVWTAERDAHPDERLYTVFPEKFALSSLYRPDPPARTTFRATVFRGHLERGGEAIDALSDLIVDIRSVVFAARFGGADKPDDLTYFLFGRGSERFLAHTIRQAPDFDQLLSVRLEGPAPSDDELARGVEVVLPGRPNAPAERLRDGTAARARGHVTGAHQFLHLDLVDLREIYFEEGELMSARGAFEPTALEVEAGFGN